MQIFPFGADIQARAKELSDFASRSENWYRWPEVDWIPGDRPEYIMMAGTLRVVFSWTATRDGVFRHMTISNITNYPQPFAVWTMAHMLGFTGATPNAEGLVEGHPESWQISMNDTNGARYIQLVERVLQ